MDAIEQIKIELESKQSEYLHLLQTLIVRPKNTPGYYPAEAQKQLYQIEGRINMLHSLMGDKTNNWCKTEKEKILKACYIDTAAKKKPIYIAAGIGAAAVIIALIIFINYLSSLGDINRFEDEIQKGDKYLSEGKLNNAIDNYTAAYINYDGYKSGSYKESAFKKIETATDQIIADAQTDNNALYIAQQTINNLLQQNLTKSEKQKLEAKAKYIDNEIVIRVEDGLKTLIGNISQNNGSLDESGKKFLKEMLLLSPDNYWFNFINKKENEQNR